MITLLILVVVAYFIFTITNDEVDTAVTASKVSVVSIVGGFMLLLPFAYLIYSVIK